MGIIDIVLLVIIGIFAIKGLLKGFINEVFGILAIVVAYFVSFAYSDFLTSMFLKANISESGSRVLGYAATFIVAYLVIAIIGALLTKAFKEIKLGWINRGGGAVFGALKSAVICGLILSAILSVVPKDMRLHKDVEKSMVASRVIKITPYVYEVFNKIPKDKKVNPFEDMKKKKLIDTDAIKETVDDAKKKGKDALQKKIENLTDKELDELLKK